jgi:hypothetical protein
MEGEIAMPHTKPTDALPQRRRHRRHPIAVPAAVSALLLAALAAPATSLAAWDAPTDVSSAGADAFAPQVAVAADGDGVIVWQRDGAAGQEVQAATVSETGAVGAVQTLSAGGTNEQPKVAVDDVGNAIVVWRRSNGGDVVVQSNTLSELGAPGGRQTISDSAQDASDPAVGMDADGNALIAWEFGSGANRRIQARIRTAAGTLEPTATLPDPGGASVTPEVAMAAGGKAVVGWLGDDGTASRVRAVTMSAAGAFGPMETVSTADVDAESVGVGIDAGGDAVLTWLRFADDHFRVYARTLSAAGALGTRQTLSRAGEDAFLPEIAVAANGRSAVTWQRSDGSDFRVQAVPISAAGVPGTVKTLSAGGSDANNAAIAIDADGDSVVVWDRTGDSRIHAQTMTETGELGTLADLSDVGGSASQAQVGVDATGHAHAIWARDDGAHEIIQTTTGP